MSTSGIARTRRRTVIISALVLVAVAALSWWAGRATTTTSALARDQKAPTAPVLTAPVVLKRLGTTLQAQGKLVAAGSETITVGSISVPGAQSIVTANVVRVGGQIHNGSVVAQVAGRPVFAFAGQTPMYRSLASGDTGPDVAQLQHDLASIGYSITDTAGTYGPSTSAALAELYKNSNYAAPASMPVPGGGRKAPRLIVEPQSEIVFLPQLPARVASTKETLGKAIGSPAVTLTYGSMVVDATLSTAQGYLIEPGDPATVRLGSHLLAGTVRSVKRSVRAREASAKIALRGVATHAHVGSQVTVIDQRRVLGGADTRGANRCPVRQRQRQRLRHPRRSRPPTPPGRRRSGDRRLRPDRRPADRSAPWHHAGARLQPERLHRLWRTLSGDATNPTELRRITRKA